jgi:hypothetical protein
VVFLPQGSVYIPGYLMYRLIAWQCFHQYPSPEHPHLPKHFFINMHSTLFTCSTEHKSEYRLFVAFTDTWTTAWEYCSGFIMCSVNLSLVGARPPAASVFFFFSCPFLGVFHCQACFRWLSQQLQEGLWFNCLWH